MLALFRPENRVCDGLLRPLVRRIVLRNAGSLEKQVEFSIDLPKLSVDVLLRRRPAAEITLRILWHLKFLHQMKHETAPCRLNTSGRTAVARVGKRVCWNTLARQKRGRPYKLNDSANSSAVNGQKNTGPWPAGANHEPGGVPTSALYPGGRDVQADGRFFLDVVLRRFFRGLIRFGG